MVLKRYFVCSSVVLIVISGAQLSVSQSTTSTAFATSTELKNNFDPSRGTIVYRRRNFEGQSQIQANKNSNGNGDGKVLRRVSLSSRQGRLNPSAISRSFFPGACACMGYWDCITNNGQVYSYCGISDSEVCCFYRRTKDTRNNNGSSVNNDIFISKPPVQAVTESPTTYTTPSEFSNDELLTTGNEFARVSSTPTNFGSTLPSTTLTDVDIFYSLENGNGDLMRITSNEETTTNSNNDNRGLEPICGRQVVNWNLDSHAEFREWPWHVALLEVNQDLYTCGGSLISNNKVITAAHCVFSYTRRGAPRLKVRAGEYDVSTNDEPDPYFEVAVERIIIHPNYNNATLENDIAIIELKSPLNYTSNVRPICLPSASADELSNQQKCVVAGWGRVSETSPFSVVLKEIVVPLWSHQHCQNQLQISFGTSFQLSETALCAGEKGHDACDGDGGGGLVCFNQEKRRWSLIGIVSFGIGCGRIDPGLGVYTSVFEFINWITAFNYLQ